MAALYIWRVKLCLLVHAIRSSYFLHFYLQVKLANVNIIFVNVDILLGVYFFTFITSCRWEPATICPRPGLQVMTRYTAYTHLDPLLTRCPYWPASTANQGGLMTLTFDLLTLEVVSQSRVTWATSVPILVFLGLSVLDLRDRLTSDRHPIASSLNAPGLGGGSIIKFSCVV